MQTQPAKMSLLTLLTLLLSTGCVSMNKSMKPPKACGPTVVVVPVKGEPVTVISQHLGTSIAFGMVGGAIEMASAGDAREELAARLNRDAPRFEPEVIFAEELARLLKESRVAAFQKPILQEESVLLPAAQELRIVEPQPFKGRRTNRTKWLGLYNDWRKGPPLSVSSQAGSGGAGLIGVEVRFQSLEINHENRLWGAALVRFVDHSTRKVIGARYVGYENFKIQPVTTSSDLAVFDEDFRRFASQLARQALTGLKLL